MKAAPTLPLTPIGATPLPLPLGHGHLQILLAFLPLCELSLPGCVCNGVGERLTPNTSQTGDDLTPTILFNPHLTF